MFAGHKQNEPTAANCDPASTSTSTDDSISLGGEQKDSRHAVSDDAKYVGIMDNDQSRLLKEEEYSACVALLGMAASPTQTYGQNGAFDINSVRYQFF